MRAFTNLSQFRGEARLSTWLARIVINEALGLIRRRRPAIDIALVSTNPALDAEIIRFPGANRVPDPEMTMAQTEIRMLLERAIDKLPPTFREVLIARLVEGMSVAETAELFGIPSQTVKTSCSAPARSCGRKWSGILGRCSATPSPSPESAAND